MQRGNSSNSEPGQTNRGHKRRNKKTLKASDHSSRVQDAPPAPELPHGIHENAEDHRKNSTTGYVDVSDLSVTASHEDDVASGSRTVECGETEVAENDSVLKRLNALDLFDDVSDLAEEQQEINKQDQADEVLALQAIFGEDFVMLEDESADPAYMISIHVEIPMGLDVMMKVPIDLDRLSIDASSPDAGAKKIRACTLQFLPPIRFIYRPHQYYPSHYPPKFILSAHWLSKTALSKLCQGFDALWREQVGDVAIYAWAEWLRANCLSHLGIVCELELESGCESGEHDNRVFSAQSSSDMIIPLLMRYNEERINELFLTSLHTCNICFIEQLGKDFIRLPCKHFFCSGCMKQYTSMHVKEGTIKSLQCPGTSCKGSIPPTILKQLLEEDEFIRWENLLLQKTLDSMVDVVYCPRCETVCIEEEDHYAQCTGCLFNFCSLCKGPRHVGQQCLSPEARLHILEGRQKGVKEKKMVEQNFVNEILNLKYMLAEAKQCPTCKMAISKVEGCNKVTCANCGTYFCYKCNKAIEGYDHFRDGCVLFDDEEIQRWQALMNVAQPDRVPGERGGLNWRLCPNCRQENLKEGNNNHIFCWSCQQHFCALCRNMVRRNATHFGSGPNKCKQHTLD